MVDRELPPVPLGRRFRAPKRVGRGRKPGSFDLGSEGECWCPRCNIKVPYERGIPCYEVLCPRCRQSMIRSR